MSLLPSRPGANAAGLLTLLGCFSCTPAHKPIEGPNVVLIVIDTLRADHLGCYGYPLDTSPSIDAFADGAMLFENAFSHAADTRFAMASLLSGYLVHETTVLDSPELPDSLEMLAEVLGSRGYQTAAVISNWVLSRGKRYEQGFDIYDDTMDQVEERRSVPERTAKFTTDRAIEVLEQLSDDPFFLWVHYQDPHGPYTPPPGIAEQFVDANADPRPIPSTGSLSGKGGIPDYQRVAESQEHDSYRSRYDGEIRHVDTQIQRLFDALTRLQLEEDTLIMLTSDHGEGMGEHDYYFAHGENLYRNQIHVPLVLKWGDRLRGRRFDQVRHVDIFPTVLGVVGIEVPPGLRGIDLRHADSRRGILAETRSPHTREARKLSWEVDGMKLIATGSPRAIEFYDIRDDPGEVRDLSEDPDYQDEVRALSRELAATRREDRLQLTPSRSGSQPTDEDRKKLLSLGYVE